MRVSVAIAAWNGERFIGEQLESIARQTHPPEEVVVSDDASDDRTLEIVERFARAAPFDVVVLKNDRRIGHGENFFRAMIACRGDAIALCDQDDVWHPAKLDLCRRPLESDPDVSLVAHSARVVDESLGPSRWRWAGHIRRRDRLQAGALPPFACDRFAGFQVVFRSIFVQAADLPNRPPPPRARPDEGVRISHDVWANLVCGALGSLVLLPDRLALHRRHGSNATAGPRRGGLTRVKSSFALRAERDSYLARSDSSRARCAYLESLRPLARELGHSAPAGLEATVAAHRRYTAAMEHRAEAYGRQRRPSRALQVGRNALRGDYGRRASGGLGLPSLARDALVGLVRARGAQG